MRPRLDSRPLRRRGAARRVLLSALALCSVPAALPAAEPPAAPAPEPAAVGPRHRIAWATYLGGEGWDQAREILVLPDGSLLVGAQTCSRGMVTTEGALQPRYAGDDPALGHGGVYGGDCYLARLSADGGKILAATYFGGSAQERNVYGMELDRDGNIVIATATRSSDAPTTEGCFQRAYGGGPADMLVAKISPDLRRLLWCTYVGGKGDDFPRGGVTLDADGNVWVVGTSTSSDFPTTEGALQRELRGPRDSAIVKLSADGARLLHGTLLGGAGEDDAIMGARIDGEGTVHVAGHTRSTDFPVSKDAAQPKLGGASDVYLAGLSGDLRELYHATYLGGTGDEFAEHTIRLERYGTVLVAGCSASPDFPTTKWAVQKELKGDGDGFLARLTSDGRRFALATLLGGSGRENFLMPTPDADGNIWIVGSTSSRDFPATPDALQGRYGGGSDDCALALLTQDGSRAVHASYLGGSGDEMVRSIALGPEGELYLVGSTSSADFPVTEGALQTAHGGNGDAFVARLEGLPRFPPGEWVSLFDGKSFSGWRPFRDDDWPDMYGKVSVSDGSLVLEAGAPMTGIGWTRNVPRDGYEIALEGRRLQGNDFFCGLTLPVGSSHLTWILGGWGGTAVGLSNVDGYSAVENETTSYVQFEEGRWYRLRLRVGPKRIQAWIDDERKIDLERGAHQFSIWPQQEPSKPLGITSYYTKAALKDLRIRRLAAGEE